MTLGPGDVVAGRYDLIRMLGGGDGGRVYVAFDRHLSREVALRFVEAGDRAAAAALLEEGRRMASVQSDSPQAVSVLDAGEIDGGGAYTATELVDGTPLDDVARRRAPIPAAEATRYGVELLDACLAVERHERGLADTVVASALATPDGHIRVTRFARAGAPTPADADPASIDVAATMRGLLAGAPIPAALRTTLDDAEAGRIRTADELRARLLADDEIARDTVVLPPPPPTDPPPRAKWPWIVGAIVAVLVIAAVAVFFATRSNDGGGTAVEVPDVTGLTAAEAVSTLQAADFTTATAGQVSTTVNKGLVISTSPAAGASADAGSRVTITVSQGTGTVAVPALVGLSQAKATSALTTAGLVSRIVQSASSTVPEGDVITQDPAAGLQIDVGSTVAITVSTGAASVTVPDVTGQTLTAATTALQRAGLTVGQVQRQASSAPANQVVSQNPAASADVAPGTAVVLVVSQGRTGTTP